MRIIYKNHIITRTKREISPDPVFDWVTALQQMDCLNNPYEFETRVNGRLYRDNSLQGIISLIDNPKKGENMEALARKELWDCVFQ